MFYNYKESIFVAKDFTQYQRLYVISFFGKNNLRFKRDEIYDLAESFVGLIT
jgi:hypothetical protein